MMHQYLYSVGCNLKCCTESEYVLLGLVTLYVHYPLPLLESTPSSVPCMEKVTQVINYYTIQFP